MATISTKQLKLTSTYSVNIMESLPKNFDPTRSYPLLCYLVGAGEIGLDATKLTVNGPFANATIRNGGDVGDLIIIALQYQNANPRPSEVQLYVNALNANYKINALIASGISRGSQCWDWYVGAAESNLKQLAAMAIASSEGPPTDSKDAPCGWYPQWFKDCNVPYWAVSGDQDQFYSNINATCILTRYNQLKAVAPQLAFLDVFPGLGHSSAVWSKFYDPAWISSAVGKSLYQWAVSFGTSAVVTPPVTAPPPVTTPPPTPTKTIVSVTVTYSDGTTSIIH